MWIFLFVIKWLERNPKSEKFENMQRCYVGHQQNITVASFESSSVKLDLKSQTWANPEIIHFNWRQWPLKIKFELYAFDLTSQTLQVNFMSLFIKKASWKSWMVEIKIFFVSQLNLRLDTKIINFHFALECIAMKLYKKRISAGIDVQLKLFWSWLLYKPGFIDEWPLF